MALERDSIVWYKGSPGNWPSCPSCLRYVYVCVRWCGGRKELGTWVRWPARKNQGLVKRAVKPSQAH